MGCECLLKNRAAALGCGSAGCVRHEVSDKKFGGGFGRDDGVDEELGWRNRAEPRLVQPASGPRRAEQGQGFKLFTVLWEYQHVLG